MINFWGKYPFLILGKRPKNYWLILLFAILTICLFGCKKAVPNSTEPFTRQPVSGPTITPITGSSFVETRPVIPVQTPASTSTPAIDPTISLLTPSSHSSITATIQDIVILDDRQFFVLDNLDTNSQNEILTIMLHDDTDLVSQDGTLIKLGDIHPGATILAMGHSFEEGVLDAIEVVVLTNKSGSVTPTPTSDIVIPTPFSLSSISQNWINYSYPDQGVTLSMPDDWEPVRMPGGYWFKPVYIKNESGTVEGAYSGNVLLGVYFQDDLPASYPEIIEAALEKQERLTPDFLFPYTSTIQVNGWNGVAIWDTSPMVCVQIYVPAYDRVHAISFSASFCEPDMEALNEFGQRSLDSVSFFQDDGSIP